MNPRPTRSPLRGASRGRLGCQHAIGADNGARFIDRVSGSHQQVLAERVKQIDIMAGGCSAWRREPGAHLVHEHLIPQSARSVEAPVLIKGYLRCGAKVMGPPAWDPVFNTADLPLIMRTSDLPDRYKRHFLGA